MTAPAPTGQSQSAPIRRGRARRIAVLVGLTGALVAVAVVMRQNGSGGGPTFSPADHGVTYQIEGTGTVREITYSVGTAAPTVLHNVKLPWQTDVKVVAGVGGDVVNLNSTNPGLRTKSPSEAAPVVCRILVDGTKTAQRTSTDGFSDTSCSAALGAKKD
jgi:hypothetical protein